MPPETQSSETIPSFAQRIKQKYPAYAGVEDAELVERIVEKYPMYRERVSLAPQASEETQFSKRVGQLFDFLASPAVQQRIVDPGQRTLAAAQRLAEFGITPETFNEDIPLGERIGGTALRALSGLVEVAIAPFALPLEAAVGPELLKPFTRLGEEAGEAAAAIVEPLGDIPGLRDIQPVTEEAARLAGGFAPYVPFAAAGVAARPRPPSYRPGAPEGVSRVRPAVERAAEAKPARPTEPLPPPQPVSPREAADLGVAAERVP
ncbi:hypothetical protein LCGC14_2972410, partial [marine sediment metagenome]